MSEGLVFVTAVADEHDRARAALLVASLRRFGGAWRDAPVQVFTPPGRAALAPAGEGIEARALERPADLAALPFADKVFACAQAEAAAGTALHTLVWLDPACLVLRPPAPFDLGEGFDAALRPVHLRNVGLPADAPRPDAFWQRVYAELGVADLDARVESFVDAVPLRAYFNSHGFALRPACGLARQWRGHFERLARDRAFLATACADAPHRTFLFQAVLSALVAVRVAPARLRLLPPTCNYPWHLHARVPPDRRAAVLDHLVSVALEDERVDPAAMTGIEVREPLRRWLAAAARGATSP